MTEWSAQTLAVHTAVTHQCCEVLAESQVVSWALMSRPAEQCYTKTEMHFCTETDPSIAWAQIQWLPKPVHCRV